MIKRFSVALLLLIVNGSLGAVDALAARQVYVEQTGILRDDRPGRSAMGERVRAACPRMVQPADQGRMVEEMKAELLYFVQNNYPSCVNRTMRGLQGKQGRLRQELFRSADFLKNFAAGPVSFEGIWKGASGARQYVSRGIIRGVKGHPAAVIFLHTYPSMFKPFTIASVDRDGDGKVDLESERFIKRANLESWLLQIFPA